MTMDMKMPHYTYSTFNRPNEHFYSMGGRGYGPFRSDGEARAHARKLLAEAQADGADAPIIVETPPRT